eukprot:m.270366 g.270366  ORF g.270366 m.270366 type:complete len:138 (-) comp19735_c1_seq12:814-1227(-)
MLSLTHLIVSLTLQAKQVSSLWPFQRALVLDRYATITNTVDLNTVNARVNDLASMAKESLDKIRSVVSAFSLLSQMSSLETVALLQACAKGDATQVYAVVRGTLPSFLFATLLSSSTIISKQLSQGSHALTTSLHYP